MPQSFYIVDTIPRTATGKIQRRKVAEVLVGGGLDAGKDPADSATTGAGR